MSGPQEQQASAQASAPPTTATTEVESIKIAILDDYTDPPTSNPAFQKLFLDSSTKSIPNATRKVDTYTFYPETLNTRTLDGLAAARKRLLPYQIICSMRERSPFPASLLKGLPNLKVLLTTGMRNAAIDLVAAKECGIVVAGTNPKPNAVKNFDATNEQTWALILAVAKGLCQDDLNVKKGHTGEGGWQSGLNLALAGKTLGVLGLGRLGVQCAVTGKLGFGMDVVAWSENLTQEKADQAAGSRGLPEDSFRVAKSKEDFFRSADVVSVHYVLSDRSRGIVGPREFSWMKKSAVLVNTSRGPLVEEHALIEALAEGYIRGAGLDVFDDEPLPADSIWRVQEWGKKVVLSPHMGYVEEETMVSWYEQQAGNVRRYLQGEDLVNVMTPQ